MLKAQGRIELIDALLSDGLHEMLQRDQAKLQAWLDSERQSRLERFA